MPSTKHFNEYRAAMVAGLIEGGIESEAQVDAGLKKALLRESPFFPSVGEFVALCKGDYADFSLPSHDAAFVMAAHWDWSNHPIIYKAALAVGIYEIKTQPEKFTKKAFVTAYKKLAGRVMTGEKFEQKPGRPAIESGAKRLEAKPVTPEESNKARLQALSMLGLKSR